MVVGSGASGVHFARRALALGRRVLMVDVGHKGLVPLRPDLSFTAMKKELERPEDYFLGKDLEALILPDAVDEYYGFPPNKAHVFREVSGYDFRARGFKPLHSFARGGLAQAWTGGSYPFNAAELEAYPFDYEDLRPYYEEVAQDIGMTGAPDDLEAFMPWFDGLQEPLELDAHGAALMASYDKKKDSLQCREKFYMGRARLAVLGADRGERKACQQLNRCLWSCPVGSLYVPEITLNELLQHENFDYRSGLRADAFDVREGQAKALWLEDLQTGERISIAADRFVLAAGTLASSKIFLDSFQEKIELEGLMDNRQVLMPFVNLKRLGRRWQEEAYQYNQLAMALDLGGAMDYVHGLVTTLKAAMIHPVVQSLPFSLPTSQRFFREMHGALGLVNVNFSDHRRAENKLTLERGQDGSSKLLISYRPAAGEADKIADVCRRFRRILLKLGCLAPKGMTHERPMGASVHYSGTLPMTVSGDDLTLDENGRSRRIDNLWFVDGTGLPSLPAKNLTFTLMANATRIAAQSFG